MTLFRSSWLGLLFYLTNIGSHLTLTFCILILLAAKYPSDPNLQRYTAILMEITCLAQVLIVGVYWAVLHRYVDQRFVQLQVVDSFAVFVYYRMIIVHSVPGFVMLTHLVTTRAVFIPGHSLYLMMFGVGYLMVNYLGTVYRGNPVYPFLTWTDSKSAYVCIGLGLGAFILYHFIAMVTAIVRKKPLLLDRKGYKLLE
jgi:hypothetical protein